MSSRTSAEQGLGRELVAESKRRLIDQSLPRLKQCLELLSEEEIWFRPNVKALSVGNLVLHLCGNVTQHIVSGLGGAPDTRQRAEEFAARGPIPTPELIAHLDSTMAEVESVLDRLDPATLMKIRVVQGEERSGVRILTGVVEHFSYHLGQIVYVVKATKAIDLSAS